MNKIWSILAIVILSHATLLSQVNVRLSRVDADQGTIVDIDFTVSNYNRISGFEFALAWNSSVITFESVKNINSNAIVGLNFASHFNFNPNNPGRLIVSYSNPDLRDTSVADGTRLFTVSYRVVGNVGTSTEIDLVRANELNPIEFVDHRLVNVGFTLEKGRVSVTGMGSPGLQFRAGEVTGATNSKVCVPITANGFTNIGAFQYTLSWNPAFMTFDGLENTNILIGAANIQVNNAAGTLTVSWNDPFGITRPAGSTLFEVCFTVVANSGCTDVRFVGSPVSIEASLPNGTLINVTTVPGRVCVDGVPDCVPNGFTLSFPRVTQTPGESFCVQLRVFNFTELLSLQASIEWNPNVLEFLSVRDFRLPDFTLGNFNLMSAASGFIGFVWSSGDPVTIQDNGILFEICFRAIGSSGTFSNVEFNQRLVSIEATSGAGVIPVHLCQGRVNIAAMQPLVLTVSNSSNPTCEGVSNGSITVQASGGAPPYASYAWTRDGNPISGSGSSQNNLGPGLYRIVVTDAGGATAAVTINLVPQFNINVQVSSANPNCPGDTNGSISLDISGNTGNVTYQWENGSTQQNRSNLGPGNYSVTITYGGNPSCSVTRNISLTAPPPINISGSVNNIDRSITLTVSGGTPPYSYNWAPSGNNSPTLTDLPAGNYFVTVSDSNGCTATGGPFVIVNSEDFFLQVETSDYNGFGVSCFGTCDGFIEITPVNGTPPFTYQWSVTGVTGPSLTNRCVGNYRVTVTDANGRTATAAVQLTTPERIRVELESFTPSSGANDGSATVLALGGRPPFTYTWSDGTPGPRISNQGPIVMTVNVRDQNGCQINFPVNFGQVDDCFEHRKVITPNGDGLNDELTFTCLGGTTNRLEVFDRYGKLVYAANNYTNDWQGTAPNGSVLPDGAYHFVLSVTTLSGIERVIKGTFNILYSLK